MAEIGKPGLSTGTPTVYSKSAHESQKDVAIIFDKNRLIAREERDNSMTDTSSRASAEAGAAIYSRQLLSVYDLGVIKLSNTIVWGCPAHLILNFYNENISANHLDVGVGTGYYLDKCRFPLRSPRVTLLDLNPNSLSMTAERLRRYRPTTSLANILEPVQLDQPPFDSIGLNYLFHCLPGRMNSKEVVFENLEPWLNPGGIVFGTTILGQGIHQNFLARRLMALYNARDIFSNSEDNMQELESILKRRFRSYWTKTVGCVAFFRAA